MPRRLLPLTHEIGHQIDEDFDRLLYFKKRTKKLNLLALSNVNMAQGGSRNHLQSVVSLPHISQYGLDGV
jgi:hypothetical protein